MQVIIISLLFICMPIFLKNQGIKIKDDYPKIIYFFATGLAFFFIELVFIHRFILYLASPIYAASVIISGFLFFAGLGSLFTARYKDCLPAKIKYAIYGIILFSCIHLLLFNYIIQFTASMTLTIKIVISLLSIAPSAFCMGIPFPLGLNIVTNDNIKWTAWAWAINGYASVISVIIATLFSLHFGFNMVIIIALVLYYITALFANKLTIRCI